MLLIFCTAVAPLAQTAELELTYLVHGPGRTPGHSPLIVLLHGSGADENDMISLWPQLPQNFIVVSPRAPFGDGTSGYRWYRKGGSTGADIRLSIAAIGRLVEAAIKRFDADPQRVFLVGFSQGAVLVYHAVLQNPGRFRGAAVLSGSLYGFDAHELSPRKDWQGASLFIGHGTADARISFATGKAAHAQLDRLGVPNEFHAYPGMQHETQDREIADLAVWLTSRNGAP
ncbi:alpha/beta hydrolase [Hyphomicrobium sp. 2TAF46]|uniref:alpha/beta hydrolase n=1 Tax=Hyphomicrobium sp. 2TAF46 TaxID=3233019 RepID=UPI003F90EC42